MVLFLTHGWQNRNNIPVLIRNMLAGVSPPNGARRWPQHNVDAAEYWLFHCFGLYIAEHIAVMDAARVIGSTYEYPNLHDEPKFFSKMQLKQIKAGHWVKGDNQREIFVVSNLGDGDQTLEQLLRTEEVINAIAQYLIDQNGATKAENKIQRTAIRNKWFFKAAEAFLSFLKEAGLISPAQYKERALDAMVNS